MFPCLLYKEGSIAQLVFAQSDDEPVLFNTAGETENTGIIEIFLALTVNFSDILPLKTYISIPSPPITVAFVL